MKIVAPWAKHPHPGASHSTGIWAFGGCQYLRAGSPGRAWYSKKQQWVSPPWVHGISHSWITVNHTSVSIYSVGDKQAWCKIEIAIHLVYPSIFITTLRALYLSGTSLFLWLAHSKVPMSCLYLKKYSKSRT